MNKKKHNYVVAQIASFKASYGSNFIASLTALKIMCDNINVKQIWIFPQAAAKRKWCLDLVSSGHTVYYIPLDKGIICAAISLTRITIKEKIDVYHTHFSDYDIVAWLALLFNWLRFKNIIVIWHEHSDFPIKYNIIRAVKNYIKHRLMGSYCFAIVVAEHLKERLIKTGFPSDRITIVNNGIDLERAVKASRSKEQVLSSLGIPANKILLLMFGWQPEIKGVDIALKAMANVCEYRDNLILGIVGAENLVEYIKTYFNGNSPKWLRILPQIQLPAEYMQCADIFISASRSEGFSYSICEAVLNKCRLAISDVPGVVWAHSLQGTKFFAPENHLELSQIIIGILKETESEKNKYIRIDCQIVKDKYNVTKWCVNIIKYYSICLNK